MLKIYVCGPTVYNNVHIGNIRPVVTFDLMLKVARFLKIEFQFVHNITDIDDKIIMAAQKKKVSEKEISNKYGKDYLEVLNKLNIDTISKIEYVTENLQIIIDYIQKLIAEKKAYIDQDGNVWFDVHSEIQNYGSISNRKVEEMVFEEDGEFKYKKNPSDFALWKITKEGIKFNSPWGQGRPGWHTECVALIDKNFGESIDIHGGGVDLTFPHHENENIQFFALHHKPLTHKWHWVGQLSWNGEKMSKSLGNVILANEFLTQKNYADYYKILVLSTKSTSPLDFNEEIFSNVKKIYAKYKKTYFKSLIELKKYQNTTSNLDYFNNAKKIVEPLLEFNFSDFNFNFNQLLKNFNTSINLENSLLVKTITEIFKFDFTCKKEVEKYMKIYDEWTYFIVKKNYLEADKLRTILMKENWI